MTMQGHAGDKMKRVLVATDLSASANEALIKRHSA